MAGWTRELTRARVLFEDHSLVTTSTPVALGFVRLPAKSVIITKVHTTGTYGISIAWSMDGTNTAFTTTPVMVDNTPQTISALAPYAKFTISASVSNFTAHQTTIMT